MFLKKLVVHNYKSLRHVCFEPPPLAVLIGPNAAGKSNFADSIHFLSEVYSQGLEVAIARKGRAMRTSLLGNNAGLPRRLSLK